MAKFSRRDLKDVVKECLVEILQEGLSGDRQTSMMAESISSRETMSQDPLPRKRSLDNISWNKKPKKNPNFEKNIDNITNQMTSDPILASVLADTAMTTLQEQASADSGMRHSPSAARGDSADLMMSRSDPIDIFGESAGKWAELAFGNASKL
jgi:hypothetical protein